MSDYGTISDLQYRLALAERSVAENARAQDALREIEMRHRLVVRNWAQAEWETDADGVVVTDSPSWRAYTGQTLDEWLGYGWLDAIHSDDRAYAERQWREAVAAKGVVNAEFRLRAPGGGWRWTNVLAAPVIDADGNIEKWAGLNIDIDERKCAEAALRVSEERHRSLFETISQGFSLAEVVRDAVGNAVDWRLLQMNSVFEEYVGMTVAECVGRTATEVFGSTDPQWLAVYDRVVRNRKAERSEAWFGPIDRWVKVDVYPGTGDQFTILYEDISERIQAEAALRQSAARQAFLLKLSDTLRRLSDPEIIMAEALRVLGEHLQVTRTIFAERDGEDFVVTRNFVNGVPSMVGRYPQKALGRYTPEVNNQSGRSVVYNATDDPTLSDTEKAQFSAADIASYAATVLHKADGVSIALAAHHNVPRNWTALEFELIEETAERTWAALERAQAEAARDRATALSIAQNRVLELAVGNATLPQTLEAIVATVERLSTSGVITSILLLDAQGAHLRHGAAPSLPAAYNEAIDGIDVAEGVGSCGTAAFRNTPVFVSDIGDDPLWADFRDLALEHGLRSCWSIPIRSAQGSVLGTFAMYDAEAREPTPTDLEIVDFVVRTAGLVIERANGEVAIAQSEARYRQIVEGAEGFAIVTFDPRGVITGWNSGASSIIGHSGEVAIGQPGDFFYTGKDRLDGVFARELEGALRDGRAVNERWHERKDGSRFWGSGLMMPLASDRGFVKIFLDRTTQHEAQTNLLMSETLLRDSEARLRLAVDNADVGFWDLDVVTNTLTWPDRTRAMFGILAGIPVTMQDFYDGLHPGDREMTGAAFDAAVDPDRRALYDVEYRTIGKEDGVVRWVAAKGRGVFDDVGECLRVAGTAIQITARREAEEALRELNATLEAKIAEAIAEREEAQEALRHSQKMEAMGQLTGGVAHDFNNLLTPIVGSLDMLQRRGIGGEREQRLIGAALQSADRAKTLVQRLLAFARRQPLQPIPVDVAQLITGMGDLVSSTTGPQIKVVVDAASDLPAAKADPNQLEMAILNLAVNARDAMPSGGTLRISADVQTVGPGHYARLAPASYIRLSVADTGTGMDEATLARAIEPFFSTKGVGKGTGLGLSMAHGLASQLGGALTIQSQCGLGTNVELWLPQTSLVPNSAEVVSEATSGATMTGTALLVDDEALIRMSTADMLGDLGYRVIEAGSGEEALQLVHAGKAFDLLVTDHLMPEMNGTDLALAVRLLRPDVPVLIVSGYAESEGVPPGMPRLTKPFRKDELATSLAQLSK